MGEQVEICDEFKHKRLFFEAKVGDHEENVVTEILNS